MGCFGKGASRPCGRDMSPAGRSSKIPELRAVLQQHPPRRWPGSSTFRAAPSPSPSQPPLTHCPCPHLHRGQLLLAPGAVSSRPSPGVAALGCDPLLPASRETALPPWWSCPGGSSSGVPLLGYGSPRCPGGAPASHSVRLLCFVL